MIKKINKKLISIFAFTVVIFSSLFGSSFAMSESLIDTSKKATLTILEYENAYGKEKNSEENVPLSDVEITIYKLDDKNMDRDILELEEDLANSKITLDSYTLSTGTDGIVTFKDLELGRYLVVESNIPKNVSIKMESFLIDLPRTTDNGKTWNYDVEVYPKNTTVYGDVELTKYDADGVTLLQGTVWELQVKNENGNWQKYDYDGDLATDANGKISIKNLPVGDYRLIETSTLEGYVLDQTVFKSFSVSAENTSFEFTATNEKLSLQKQVKLSDGYGKAVGAYATDTVEWKITADVAKIVSKFGTYKISDEIPQGLDYVENSFKVYAIANSNEQLLTENQDYKIVKNDAGVEFDFVPSRLNGYNSVYIVYGTTFNKNVQYGTSLIGSASLTYTNKIDENGNALDTYTTEKDSAEVHTGALLVIKTDSKGNPLKGAKFKISTSKENANNGIYIKDKDGNDLVGISDEKGYVEFLGLKYGENNVNADKASSTYYLTETESPIYEENGETKHYNLLSSAVEVIVNSKSGNYSESTEKIINKKGFVLPLTGTASTIWVGIIGAGLIVFAVKMKRKIKNEENKKMKRIKKGN